MNVSGISISIYMPSTRETFWLQPSSHCLVRVRLLHCMHVRLRNGYMRVYVQIMQHTHTHKAVTRRDEAKKILSRRRQSKYNNKIMKEMPFHEHLQSVYSPPELWNIRSNINNLSDICLSITLKKKILFSNVSFYLLPFFLLHLERLYGLPEFWFNIILDIKTFTEKKYLNFLILLVAPFLFSFFWGGCQKHWHLQTALVRLSSISKKNVTFRKSW